MIKKLIAAGAGVAAAVLSTLPVHAWSSAGCGLGRMGNIPGFGRPDVGCQFARLTSLYEPGMMMPNGRFCRSWW